MIKKFSEIYDENKTNHLLAGNGFNQNFGYDTSYKNIFKRMKEFNSDVYHEDFAKIAEDCDYDLELALEQYDPAPKHMAIVYSVMREFIRSSEYEDGKKLLKYEHRATFNLLGKILFKFTHLIRTFRLDFINALMGIIGDAPRGREKAGEFIQKFSNVFTLNYGSFLYRIEIDLNNRSKGTDKQEWKTKDGFIEGRDGFLWEKSNEQNFFYIHGAMQIYREEREGGNVEIGRTTGKGNDRIESMIVKKIDNGEVWDIVFEGTSERKRQQIKENIYMENALNKLSAIKGNLFLYGLSFFENDDHIWEAIRNNNKIDKIHISVGPEDGDVYRKRALAALDEKESDETFFDSDSINK